MKRKVKKKRKTEAAINSYLDEYHLALASEDVQQSERVTAEGIQDIFEEFHEKILSRSREKGEAQAPSLLNQLTEEDGEAFHPQPSLDPPAEAIAVEKEIEDPSGKLYQKAVELVLEAIQLAENGLLPNMDGLSGLVQSMIDLVSVDSRLLLAATDRSQEFAVSTHCVNVAILGVRLTQTLQCTPERQLKVAVAALLHEIGVVKFAKKVMYDPEQVSAEVRQRPLYSAEILGELGPDYKWLVETVKQVYEREDGGGMPLGLTGKDIREEAKILGAVDVLEACIHKRPHRAALTGYHLFCELTTVSSQSFSQHIVKALLKSFSLYPYNEYVILNTREIAKVVEVNHTNLLRPRVQLLYDADGKQLEGDQEIDLHKNTSRHITKAITYDDLSSGG
ncbi:MAG: HD domain-containing phosphohydrolase [Acidobacteriota bacterium]